MAAFKNNYIGISVKALNRGGNTCKRSAGLGRIHCRMIKQWHLVRTVLTLSGVLALLALTGCASVTTGLHQTIAIDTQQGQTQVANAHCLLSNNKGEWWVYTPATVAVHRSFGNLKVKCEKEGVEPGELEVESSTKAMVFGNVLIGGIIGAAIDTADGSAYDYPDRIVVNMGNANPAIHVDTSNTQSSPGATTTASAVPARPAAPIEVALVRHGHAGQWLLLSTHAQWDKECHSRPPPEVVMMGVPEHGQVEIRKATFPIRNNSNGSTECFGLMVDGVGVYYQPNSDFHGNETVRYNVNSRKYPKVMAAAVTVE